MSNSHALSVLIPDSVLPPEGAPAPEVRGHLLAQSSRPTALLQALTFALLARTEAAAQPSGRLWRHLYLRTDAAAPGRVWLDLTPGLYDFDLDLDGPADAAPVSPSGNRDALRQTLAAAVRRATRPFMGQAVPLLAPEPEVMAGGVASSVEPATPLAIWLATAEQLAGITRDGDGSEEFTLWTEDAEAEVSGHGVREVALAAAIFALTLRGPAPAALAAPAPAATAALSSSYGAGGTDPALGSRLQVLPVTSQRLRQAPPRVDLALLADGEATSDPTRTRIVVDISAQRAYLLVDDRIAVDTPISSGREGHATPRGTFTITEKVREGKMSTLYHCPLPFWMRLGESAVGMHVEKLPGQAASHGCIRLPRESAKVLFDHTPSGATVEVVGAWAGAELAAR